MVLSYLLLLVTVKLKVFFWFRFSVPSYVDCHKITNYIAVNKFVYSLLHFYFAILCVCALPRFLLCVFMLLFFLVTNMHLLLPSTAVTHKPEKYT